MRKTLLKVLIITCLIFIGLTACEHNVYIPEDVWEVQGKTFYKFSDALSYYLSTLGSKAITSDDIITLLRDVPESERGEGIVIPDSFPAEGNLRVDFNGHEYWFFDNLEYFFEIRHGDTIEIINGTTVIDRPANPMPKALVVDTKTVTIDDHLVDDRRPKPKALEVQEGGIVRVVSSSSNTGNALRGEVTVAGGGQLDVDGGFIEATTLDVSSEAAGEEGKVNLTAGYILVSETLSINTNGKVVVSGGLISVDTIDAESSDGTQKAEFLLTGGDMDTKNLNAGENSVVDISQPDSANPTEAYIENTTIAASSSFTVTDGDVTFRDTIEKDGEGTFEISGGEIHNPHDLTEKVEQAIEDGKGTSSVINIIIHEPLKHYPEVKVSCTNDGYEEYWQCEHEGCGKLFSDESCTTVIPEPIVHTAADHRAEHLKHVAEKEPTCVEPGNINHWYCSVCNRYFSDSTASHEYTADEVIIPATGQHSYDTVWHQDEDGHWHVCTVCTHEGEYGNHVKQWSNDKNYHWAECSICGYTIVAKEPHTFITIGGVTYCSFCGYVPESGGGVQSGFDVTVKDLIPAGYLTSSALDPTTNKYTVSFTSTNEESEPDHFNWYIDDVLVPGETGTSLEAEYRYESFNVMIVFWNDQGTGSASITLD